MKKARLILMINIPTATTNTCARMTRRSTGWVLSVHWDTTSRAFRHYGNVGKIRTIPDLNLPVFVEVQMLPSWLVHQWLQELLRACEDDP